MSKILIIGNVLKDVYLKLDEQQAGFEADANGINWLELPFNGEAHKFFRRTSVYGGAAVSLSVLSQLGQEAAILNSKSEMRSGEIAWSNDPSDYRYIMSYKGGITYFVPSERKPTDWAMPQGTPDWILVDRSTVVSARLVDELKNFLKFSYQTKLAVHAEKYTTPEGQRLMEMADIVFVEDEPPVHREEKIVDKIDLDQPNQQLVCHISPHKIVMGEAEESWSLSRTDMMTHLTVYSMIAATILGVIAAGGTPNEALMLARISAEQATLDGVIPAEKLHRLAQAELKKQENLKLIAKLLMATGKGVLAIDESGRHLAERLEKFEIKNTRQNHRQFYQLMLTTPHLKDYLSGVILSEENAKQKMPDGQNLLEYATGLGVITGIKADRGLKPLPQSEDKYTLGREDLIERLRNYYDEGYRFAKWRAAFEIGKDRPGYIAIRKNTEELANFAKECQLAGLVPIVEVEIVPQGDYEANRASEVLDRILRDTFERMAERYVDPEGCLLKTNMVMSGIDASGTRNANEIGELTARTLKGVVPKYLAGVLLLSSGQEPKEATKNLTATLQNSPFPWPVSFAFSRAFEEPVLASWKGVEENIKTAQATFGRHLAANADALHYGKVEERGSDTSIGVVDLS